MKKPNTTKKLNVGAILTVSINGEVAHFLVQENGPREVVLSPLQIRSDDLQMGSIALVQYTSDPGDESSIEFSVLGRTRTSGIFLLCDGVPSELLSVIGREAIQVWMSSN